VGVEGNFSVSFGPKPGFRLWFWSWTKLNNNDTHVIEFNFRRKGYLARVAAKKAWQEKVIGYMIDFGGGWREEDSRKTMWDKCREVGGVGE
jgi:hypothetical protein